MDTLTPIGKITSSNLILLISTINLTIFLLSFSLWCQSPFLRNTSLHTPLLPCISLCQTCLADYIQFLYPWTLAVECGWRKTHNILTGATSNIRPWTSNGLFMLPCNHTLLSKTNSPSFLSLVSNTIFSQP